MNRGGLAHSQRVPSWPRCGGGQSEGKSEERLGRNLAAGSALELSGDVSRLRAQWPKRTCRGLTPTGQPPTADLLVSRDFVGKACPFGTCRGLAPDRAVS